MMSEIITTSRILPGRKQALCNYLVKSCYSEYIFKLSELKNQTYLVKDNFFFVSVWSTLQINPGIAIIRGLLNLSAGSTQDFLTSFMFSGNFVIRKAKKINHQNNLYPPPWGMLTIFCKRKEGVKMFFYTQMECGTIK